MDLVHQPGVGYFHSIVKNSLLYSYVYFRRHQLSLRAFAWSTCIAFMLGDGIGRTASKSPTPVSFFLHLSSGLSFPPTIQNAKPFNCFKQSRQLVACLSRAGEGENHQRSGVRSNEAASQERSCACNACLPPPHDRSVSGFRTTPILFLRDKLSSLVTAWVHSRSLPRFPPRELGECLRGTLDDLLCRVSHIS